MPKASQSDVDAVIHKFVKSTEYVRWSGAMDVAHYRKIYLLFSPGLLALAAMSIFAFSDPFFGDDRFRVGNFILAPVLLFFLYIYSKKIFISNKKTEHTDHVIPAECYAITDTRILIVKSGKKLNSYDLEDIKKVTSPNGKIGTVMFKFKGGLTSHFHAVSTPAEARKIANTPVENTFNLSPEAEEKLQKTAHLLVRNGYFSEAKIQEKLIPLVPTQDQSIAPKLIVNGFINSEIASLKTDEIERFPTRTRTHNQRLERAFKWIMKENVEVIPNMDLDLKSATTQLSERLLSTSDTKGFVYFLSSDVFGAIENNTFFLRLISSDNMDTLKDFVLDHLKENKVSPEWIAEETAFKIDLTWQKPWSH